MADSKLISRWMFIFLFLSSSRYKLWGEVLPPGWRQWLLLSGRVFGDPAAGTPPDPWHAAHLRAEGEGHRSWPAPSPLLCCHGDSGRGLPGWLPASLPELWVHGTAPRIPGSRLWGAERLCPDQRRRGSRSHLLPHCVGQWGRTLPVGIKDRSEKVPLKLYSIKSMSHFA